LDFNLFLRHQETFEMRYTIHYSGSSLSREDVSEGLTVDQVLKDPRNKSGLDYGDNVEAHIGGVPQPGHTVVRDGMSLKVHDRACSKQ
jgi:hypothetical protein